MADTDVDPVFVIDELRLRPGTLDEFLSAFRARYRPGAEARGQRLVHLLVTPPTTEVGLSHEVVILWSLEGIEGFWGMRSQNATPEVSAWWAACDAQWAESRTRRFAAAPETIPSLDAAGRVHA